MRRQQQLSHLAAELRADRGEQPRLVTRLRAGEASRRARARASSGSAARRSRRRRRCAAAGWGAARRPLAASAARSSRLAAGAGVSGATNGGGSSPTTPSAAAAAAGAAARRCASTSAGRLPHRPSSGRRSRPAMSSLRPACRRRASRWPDRARASTRRAGPRARSSTRCRPALSPATSLRALAGSRRRARPAGRAGRTSRARGCRCRSAPDRGRSATEHAGQAAVEGRGGERRHRQRLDLPVDGRVVVLERLVVRQVARPRPVVDREHQARVRRGRRGWSPGCTRWSTSAGRRRPSRRAAARRRRRRSCSSPAARRSAAAQPLGAGCRSKRDRELVEQRPGCRPTACARSAPPGADRSAGPGRARRRGTAGSARRPRPGGACRRARAGS